MNSDTIYLSPAPLYHAAPFGFCTRTLALGGTVVMMRGFDPEASLRHIQQYSITHSQWVPTMFIRMLKLDEKLRGQYDLSSHQCAIHAAAPCPKEIKHQMMDWWGPILWGNYAGTERNGTTVISPQEWLEHPGSVGRAIASIVHICDESGADVPAKRAWFTSSSRNAASNTITLRTKTSRPPTPFMTIGRRWGMWATWMKTAFYT